MAVSAARSDRLDRPLRLLIAAVLLGGIMGILDGTIVAVGVHTLARHFHSPLSTIGWVSSGYLLALTAAIPVTTWAVDRVGAKRLWLLGLGLFLVGSLASASAWDVGSLIGFRVLQGLGAGVVDPLVLVLLARGAGQARAGRVMGLMGSVLSMGPVLGPVVGGIVLQGLGWRWMFLVNLPIGAVAFALALRVLPSDPPPAERSTTRLDVAGLALLGPGFAAVVLALSQTADHATVSAWQAFVPLVAGVVLLAGYTAHALQARRVAPLIDLCLFASRGFAASVTVMALSGAAMFSSLFVLPLYYQQVRGHGALAAGLLVAPVGIGAGLAAPLAGRLSDRIGSRRLVAGGAVLTGLFELAFTQISASTSQVLPVIAALGVGVGLGFIGPPTMGSLYRTLPGPQVAQGSSVLYMLNQLGASIGIAVVALIMQTAGHTDPVRGFHGAYLWVTGASLLILAGATLIPGRPPTLPATDTLNTPRSGAIQGEQP
jgi:EmrB/QacA subfamily drug resistance transporter